MSGYREDPAWLDAQERFVTAYEFPGLTEAQRCVRAIKAAVSMYEIEAQYGARDSARR